MLIFLLGCGASPSAPVAPPAARAATTTALPAPGERGATPRWAFPDPEGRARKLAASFADVDAAVGKRVRDGGVPGYALGIVVDGKLAHVFTHGVADKESGVAVDLETRFRVGSISKTITGMAIAQLREQGKLALDDALARHLPEAAALPATTSDGGPVRIGQLLVHGAGLMRTGNYGESSRPVSAADLLGTLRAPQPLAPNDAYAYSNYGFGLLAAVVERVSGKTFRDYVGAHIAAPLGLASLAWTHAQVPAAHHARSYDKGTGKPEADVDLGAVDGSGGAFMSLRDAAAWTAFHLEAFPSRDAPDDGPLRRATVRELLRTGVMEAPTEQGQQYLHSALGWDAVDKCGERIVFKSGALEGFWAQALFLPDHGVGVVSLASTRIGMQALHADVLDALRKGGGLVRREMLPTPELEAAAAGWVTLYNAWSDEGYVRLYSEAFREDVPLAESRKWTTDQRARVGACRVNRALRVFSTRSARFELLCERAKLAVRLDLTNDGQRIDAAGNQWTYPADAARVARADAVLAELGRTKPTVDTEGDDAPRSVEDASRTLREAGGCKKSEALTTGHWRDAELRLSCKTGPQRTLRVTFAAEPAGSTKVTKVALEEVKAPETCKSW